MTLSHKKVSAVIGDVQGLSSHTARAQGKPFPALLWSANSMAHRTCVRHRVSKRERMRERDIYKEKGGEREKERERERERERE